MPSEKYEFQGCNGQTLAGRLETPEGETKAYAVFAHCFTCSKDFIASKTIARALADRGIATLRFDFTGLGNSQGDFSNTNFSSNVQDLVLAVESLAKTHAPPRIMIGHSLGGAATLAASAQINSVTAVATLGAPFDPGHVSHLFQENIDEIASDGEAKVDLFGRPFTIKKQFIDDIEKFDQRQRISSMRKALMVMHSPTDKTVGIDNAKLIYDSAHHPKSFVSLDDIDHLITKKEDAHYVADILTAWAARYLEREPLDVPNPTVKELSQGMVKVNSTKHGMFSMFMQAGMHNVFADEPLAVGGKNIGPTPYDFLLMAVGSCTAMTLQMYAKHKKIKLDSVKVELTQERVHAKDCDDCETKDGHIHEIKRKIYVKGDFDEAQKQRFMEIADKCPVHRTIEGEVKIKTEAAN